MKNRKEIFILKMTAGLNSSRLAMRTVCAASPRGQRPTRRDPRLRTARARRGALRPGRAKSTCRGTAHDGSPTATCSRVRAYTIGHRLARRVLKHKAWTDHINVYIVRSARRQRARHVVRRGRWLAGRWQGAHMACPWVTGHKPDKVLILSSPRGGRTTVKQKLTGAATAQQLSDGDGATPMARGGPSGQGGAP
jgi:hypothetical protein